MKNNDSIVLTKILGEKKNQVSPSMADDDYFEIFTFEQALKNYDLSYDEIDYGKVGNGRDGGIDGFFVFIDNELLQEDEELSIKKKSPVIELYIIQSKRSESFSETAIDKLISTITHIFDLNADIKSYESLYNSDLIEKIKVFHNKYLGLAIYHPEVVIKFVYVTKGNINDIHPNVFKKADKLKELAQKYFDDSHIEVLFLGAKELIKSTRLIKTNLQLKYLEVISSDSSYIILSNLKDYFRFITDKTGKLINNIFEANVRDYQGDIEVNKSIRKTLEKVDDLDFWWLNNGITIITTKASIAGKIITLDDAQIVNGMQTSTTIYRYMTNKELDKLDENRSILIRIIEVSDREARDRVIKATNFQTAIPSASFRASEHIQYNIEDYFASNGLYYDRRKNYYKNLGKPYDMIISIQYLSQAVMAIILKEPDNARARPSTLIKKDDDYKRVFTDKISIVAYLYCARTMKVIEYFLHSDYGSGYPQIEKNNYRFHVAMVAMIKMTRKQEYQYKNIEDIIELGIPFRILEQSLKETLKLAHMFSEENNWSLDRTAKSREFLNYLKKEVWIENFEHEPADEQSIQFADVQRRPV